VFAGPPSICKEAGDAAVGRTGLPHVGAINDTDEQFSAYLITFTA